MDAKRQQRAHQQLPATRVVTNVANEDSVSLPDVTSSLDFSTLAQPTAMGGAMGAGRGSGSGGGIGSGTGTGVGSGFGPGSGAGFVSIPSIFGNAGGAGMMGKLYDMKQNRNREEVPYDPAAGSYFPRLHAIAEKRFRESAFKEYYLAKVSLAYTLLAVPTVPAEEGPKAFQADHEIKPRGWFVHYQAKIDPPSEGDWRFVGFFDDALLVYVNNKLVLDGSWESNAEAEVRTEFGTKQMIGWPRVPYAGKWVKLRRGTTLDILIGERPGGLVGGMLMVQQKGKKYEMREKDGKGDGVPILPVFAFNEPRKEDRERMEKTGIPMAKETPIFKVNRDRFTTTLGFGED